MAFKKTLVQKLFNLSKFSTPTLSRASTRPASTDTMKLFPMTGEALKETLKAVAEPGFMKHEYMDENRRPFSQEYNNLPTRGRLNLDGLVAYPKHGSSSRVVNEQMWEEEDLGGLTLSEVKKVLRATQLDLITSKLKNVEKDWVTYREFIEKLVDFCGGNREQAIEFAKILDDCGIVIVFGNTVCLRPHRVSKVIRNLVPPTVSTGHHDTLRKELEAMEEKKAIIDQKAEALVRRELKAGLGFMVVQTATFMRLTFWELSWDVMEPICFFVTSGYFMLGYTFFLKTSKEPSFEGFFQSRFNAKQKRLMDAQEFDLKRYNELRKMFYPHDFPSSLDDSKVINLDHYHEVN